MSTVAATVAAIKALPGMTARRTDGEWRVTYTAAAITEREGVTGKARDERAESLACYTNDADDALATAAAMSRAWYGDNAPAMVNPEIVSDADAGDIRTVDGIESGHTGPDWEPSAAELFYAQNVETPALMAFGPTREAALAALEAGKAEPVARAAVDPVPVDPAAPHIVTGRSVDGTEYLTPMGWSGDARAALVMPYADAVEIARREDEREAATRSPDSGVYQIQARPFTGPALYTLADYDRDAREAAELDSLYGEEPALCLSTAAMGGESARLALNVMDSPPVDPNRHATRTDESGRQFIDMTPTWAEILPTLLALVTDGDATGRRTAREELARMAGLADSFVAARKAFKAAAL